MPKAQTSAYSRVFVLPYRARPSVVPQYKGFVKAGGLAQGLGDVTPVRVPSDTVYGQFDEIGVTRGAEDRPTVTLTARYPTTRSEFEKLAKVKCPMDVQIHFGRCKNPTLFDTGWDKIVVLENAFMTNYSTGDLGALDPSEDTPVDETIDLSGEIAYEIVPVSLSERAKTDVGQEQIAIVVCGGPECGDCGTPNDGCQHVFSVSKPFATSPGVLPEVVFSADGMTTSGDTWITTITLGQDPTGAACVGDYLVVISQTNLAHHYAKQIDILNGVETWTKVATGYVATKGPNAIWSVNPSETWVVGQGGYIYFMSDVTAGVTVNDAGVTTVQNLNDVHFYDSEHGVIVGAANTVLKTVDGASWSVVTGPDTVHTPSLASVFMLTENIWFVGTADNALWRTEDGGVTWVQNRFPGDTVTGGGTGTVLDIKFATDTVGYIAVQTSATAGKIYRTISGGNSWYIIPEGSGSIPANDKINSLATCYKEANVVYGAGLADNGGDGIIVKAS